MIDDDQVDTIYLAKKSGSIPMEQPPAPPPPRSGRRR